MDSLQIANHRMISSGGMRQSQNTLVGDSLAFDQTDTAKFWQSGQLLHTEIGQTIAASQVDIANAVARLDQLDDCTVGDV